MMKIDKKKIVIKFILGGVEGNWNNQASIQQGQEKVLEMEKESRDKRKNEQAIVVSTIEENK